MPIVEITFSIPFESAAQTLETSCGVVVDADDLEHHVRVDAVGAEAEREDDVVDVAHRRRAEHDRAPAAEVLGARLDPEVLQRLVDRRGRQMGVEVAALAVVDGAVGEHDELGAVAHPAHRLLLDPLDRPGGALGLEQRRVDRRAAAAELLPEVLHQPGLVRAGDLAVGGVRERREVVVAAEDHRERGLDRAGVGRPGRAARGGGRTRRGSRSAPSRARGRSPGW